MLTRPSAPEPAVVASASPQGSAVPVRSGKSIPEIVLGLCKAFDSESESESESGVDRKGQSQESFSPSSTSSITPRQKPLTMAMLQPQSVAMTEHRREAIRLAREQEDLVKEKCGRTNTEFPPYNFQELIGKGSYGRVYRCRNTVSGKVVAIKVIDIDDADFKAGGQDAEEQIKDFQKEVRILQDIKTSRVPNLNEIIEARSVHSQLWMVSEHVPGGSVKTLMRATKDKLSEKYIVPVAREVAKALAGLHKAGFMHRDVKAANILVHEMGSIQLCDFGIAAPVAHYADKRKTFIGTLHYMAPEIFDEDYDLSVDTWAFGCSIYEMAVGRPPNTDLLDPRQLRSRMRRLNKGIELPAGEEYSDGLRKLVSDILLPNKADRISMSSVLEHEYLQDTESSHPTTTLRDLVQEYYKWLLGGGNRVSLFINFGARGAEEAGDIEDSSEDWNFDVSSTFSKRMSTMYNLPDFSQLGDDFVFDPDDAPPVPALPEGSIIDKKNFERRVERGARELQNIFDQSRPDYEYKAKRDFVPMQAERRISDLPLRAAEDDRPYSIASNVIDLGEFDMEVHQPHAPVRLADPPTIRANRSSSRLYRSTTADQELHPPVPPMPVEDYQNAFDDSDRPKTRDFSFPPKEWMQQADKSDGPASEAVTQTAPVKNQRKTMEWSFASAMAEVGPEDEEAIPTPAPPPLLRSQTEVVTAQDYQNSSLNEQERPGTAMSETDVDPFHFDQRDSVASSRFASDRISMALENGGHPNAFYEDGDPSGETEITIPDPLSARPMAGRNPVPFNGDIVDNTSQPRTSAYTRMDRQGSTSSANGNGNLNGSSGSGGTGPRGNLRGYGTSSTNTRSPYPLGILEFPEISPPSAAMMNNDTSTEQLERELSNLLYGMGEALDASEKAIGAGHFPRRGRRRGGVRDD